MTIVYVDAGQEPPGNQRPDSVRLRFDLPPLIPATSTQSPAVPPGSQGSDLSFSITAPLTEAVACANLRRPPT